MSEKREAPPVLTGKQLRYLRGLGHPLAPATQIGKEGLSETLVSAVDRALEARELVKIRLGQNAPDDRHEAAEALAERCGAALVQVLGRTMLLYRPNPEESGIVLPSGRGK